MSTRPDGIDTIVRVRGFSLLEMSLVLVIIGIVGALLWQLLPRLQQAATVEPPAEVELRLAHDAVVGFALAHARLPCPDTDDDGLEDCAASVTLGELPQRTLGQLLPVSLRYAVTRSSSIDLAALEDRYQLHLPAPATSVVAAAQPLPHRNGLDLCIALRHAQAATIGIAVGPHAVPVAFALAHPGRSDASGDGQLFDGLNSGGGFAAPDAAIAAGYDDSTAATGFGALAQQLGCLHRLAVVNGAVRAAVAAQDLADLAWFYKDFRHFANVHTRQHSIDLARGAVKLAIANVAIAVAAVAIAIATAAESLGAGAVATAPAVAALVIAGTSLAQAEDGLDEAIANKAVAEAQDAAATATRAQYAAWALDARARALQQDQAGLIK